MGEYQDKWKDPRWQKARLEILERDFYRCQLCCDITVTLAVHHIEYTAKEPWDEPRENLITLCEHCHGFLKNCKTPEQRSRFDDMTRIQRQYFFDLMDKGWLSPEQSLRLVRA